MYITNKKRSEHKLLIAQMCGCNTGCEKCATKIKLVDQMSDANIPVAYWDKKIKTFSGPQNVIKETIDYIKNLKTNFNVGKNIYFTGSLGTGKTFSATAILKAALLANYDAYYTTLNDLVFYLTDYELKKEFYSKVTRSDFVCIDEVDSRHLGDTEQSIEFFGRNFERILRYRIQNNLPIVLATNNASLEEAFGGQFRKVVQSLIGANTVVVSALGKDHRLK